MADGAQHSLFSRHDGAGAVENTAIPDEDTVLEDSPELPIALELMVRDHDVVEALAEHPPGPQRNAFALDALRIGVLALRNARGRVDADLVRRESTRLVQEVERTLDQHSQRAHERMTLALKEYFDPESGRFNERVQRLLCEDGVDKMLRSVLGGDGSHLATTLDARIGAESPLMKMLDPERSQGLVASLRGVVDAQLTNQREHVLKEFSLDNEQGALARLVKELTAKHGDLSKDLQLKIDEVIREFSLDKEDSALNRLVNNVERAQRTISSEFSLDNEQSALSRLKTMLEATQGAIHGNLTLDDDTSPLARLKRELLELLTLAEKKNSVFQEEVKVSLAKMTAAREESLRSTRHGAVFEEAVCEFLAREAQHAGDIATPTGHTTGLIRHCKVGDLVLELGPDSAAPGAKIVIEAKEDSGYNLAAARQEIEQARQNRGADFGIFVFSKACAPRGIDQFQRFGSDLIVVWDAEDPWTDVFLKAGVITARALSFRSARECEAQAADFDAIDRAVLEIEKRAGNLESIKKSAETIRSSSDKILKRVEIDQEALEKQLATLREKLDDLRLITAAAPNG